MKIKANKTYPVLIPGLHKATLIEAADLGKIQTPKGERHRIRLVWETELKTAEGQPYRVARLYTPSLSTKSALYKDLYSLLGNAVNQEEFDTDTLIGMKCQVMVTHVTKNERIYANVTGVFPVVQEAA